MAADGPPTLYYGALVDPVDLRTFRALPRALLAVAPRGDIAWLEEDVPAHALQEVLAAHGLPDAGAEVVPLRRGEFLMPGFVDTHTVRFFRRFLGVPDAYLAAGQHAPQVPNIGRCGLRRTRARRC